MSVFRLKIIGHLVLLIALLFVGSWLWLKPQFAVSQLVLIVMIGLLIYSLFLVTDKTNRSLSHLLFALKHRDFTMTNFKNENTQSFSQLHATMSGILKSLGDQQLVQSKGLAELESVVNAFPLPLVRLNGDGHMEYSNLAFNLNFPSENVHDKIDADFIVADQIQLRDLQGETKQLKRFKQNLNGRVESEYYVLHETDNDTAWRKQFQVLSHETMNGVSAIAALAYGLEATLKEQEDKSKLEEVNSRLIERCEQLTALLEQSSRSTWVTRGSAKWLDVNELLKTCINEAELQSSRVQLSIQLESENKIQFDQTHFTQVINNIIDNAMKALQGVEQAQINFRFYQEAGSDCLEISNNGEQIPVEVQNAIFQPAFTTRSKGRGIGLTLCRQLMRQNGGSIYLKSSDKNWTKFELRFG